jgi:hypothetical protein
MRRLAALTAAIAVFLGSTTDVAAYTILDAADQNRNGVVDSWTVDDNGDGRVDRLLIDGNENGACEVEMPVDINGRAVSQWFDTNLDGYWDAVIVPYYANGGVGAQVATMIWRDVDENNVWENAYYDGQLDGYAEWVMVDTNFDGAADTWRANSAPAGHTATDELARNVAGIEAVNILRTAGIPVFFPTSTIPLGG